MPAFNHLSAGDHVKITDGTFVGMQGMVITHAEAKSLWETVGGEEPPVTASSGMVCVLLNLFGREVPVCLQTSQLEIIKSGS